ncbi:MAG: hypothetical protein HYS13_20085 [Planctomycetia bacterium]|nr:hypothetical protein [Planctomycetia bacterium]
MVVALPSQRDVACLDSPIQRVPSARRRTISVAAVLATHVLFDAALVVWSFLDPKSAQDLAIWIGFAPVMSQVGLIAVWAALAQRGWYFRLPLLLAVVALLPAPVAVLDFESAVVLALPFVVTALAVAVPLICIRQAGLRFGVPGASGVVENQRKGQFSIAALLMWTLAAALLIMLARTVVATIPLLHPPPATSCGQNLTNLFNLVFAVFFVWLPLMAAGGVLVALWAACGRSRIVWRILGFVAGIAAIGPVFGLVLLVPPDEGAWCCFDVPGAAVGIVSLASFLVLRIGGYKLYWLWQTQQDVGRRTP